jgi:hypothetical protein
MTPSPRRIIATPAQLLWLRTLRQRSPSCTLAAFTIREEVEKALEKDKTSKNEGKKCCLSVEPQGLVTVLRSSSRDLNAPTSRQRIFLGSLRILFYSLVRRSNRFSPLYVALYLAVFSSTSIPQTRSFAIISPPFSGNLVACLCVSEGLRL